MTGQKNWPQNCRDAEIRKTRSKIALVRQPCSMATRYCNGPLRITQVLFKAFRSKRNSKRFAMRQPGGQHKKILFSGIEMRFRRQKGNTLLNLNSASLCAMTNWFPVLMFCQVKTCPLSYTKV